jgi:hypothetical protein
LCKKCFKYIHACSMQWTLCEYIFWGMKTSNNFSKKWFMFIIPLMFFYVYFGIETKHVIPQWLLCNNFFIKLNIKISKINTFLSNFSFQMLNVLSVKFLM